MTEIIVDEKIMEQATFEGVCRLLKNRKDDGALLQCVVPLAKLLTLVVPGLTFAKTVSMEWFGDILDRGLTLLDSSEHCWDVIKNLGEVLKKEEPDYVKRANNAAIAYVLIVYTAFFDAAKEVVSSAGIDIDFDGYAKSSITEKAWAALQDRYVLSGQNLLGWELKIPGPAEPIEDEDASLHQLYELMEGMLERFLVGLAKIEMLRDQYKSSLLSTLKKLPDLAVKHYKALYMELAERFPNFAIWTRQVEHRRIEERIEGQRQATAQEHDHILKAVESLPQMMQERNVEQMLQRLYSSNQQTIERALIDDFEIPLQDQMKLPTREASFVPQNFSYLRFEEGMSLNHESDWHQGTELLDFISRAVYHQAWNKTPMLILGGPGAGKTMLSQMLSGKYFCNHYHVIVIKLRELGNDRNLYDGVENQINHRLDQIKRNGSWDQLLGAGLKIPVLVIFDGYDELLMASNEEHRMFLKRIERFQKESEKIMVHTIVTSRVTMIGKFEVPDDAVVIRLDGFDRERIDEWTRKWNSFQQHHFRKVGLAPLQIPEKKNIMELARQPLLLLLLALYDAVGNSLQKDQDLDQARLYNKLIQRFIGREEKKNDEDFDEEDGAQVIEEEMERLGVTALGMYNRSSVHIRVDQLEKDLNFLQVKPYSSQIKDEVRLLRRFFFIHSIEQGKKWNPKFGAYEFLHNSFGEFLTARYMVSLLPELLNGSKPRKCWYAAMAYVPLYTRPNVAGMLRQWATVSQEFQWEKVEDWLVAEMARTLSGDAVSALKEASGGFIRDDDHDPKNPLVHTAIYACNLMCLGALIMGQVELEIMENVIPGVWEKLVRLWQFGLGEEEMVSFSMVFKRNDEGDFVFDDCSSRRRKLDNRSGDLSNLYTSLRMEPESSLIAALNGRYASGDSFERMLEQRLPYDLSMAHKAALNSIAYNRWNNQNSERIYDDVVRLLKEHSAKNDKGTRAGIYMMLKQYVDSQPKAGRRILEKLAHTIWEDCERAETPLMRRLITELLLLMPECSLQQLGVEKIIAQFRPHNWERPEWEYHDGVRMIARLLVDFPDLCNSPSIGSFLEMPHKIGFAVHEDTVHYIISIIEQMDTHGPNLIFECVVAIESCIHTIEKKLLCHTSNTNLATIAGLLCATWGGGWWNTEGFRDRAWMLVKYANISIKDVYQARPDLVERMCMFEIEPGTTAEKSRSSQLCELLNECQGELSLRQFRMIRILAEQAADEELLRALKHSMQ